VLRRWLCKVLVSAFTIIGGRQSTPPAAHHTFGPPTISCAQSQATTEAWNAVTTREACVIDRIAARMYNTDRSASTWTARVDSANGNGQASVSSASEVIDTTHTDSLSTTHTFDVEELLGTGGSVSNWSYCGMRYSANANSVLKYGATQYGGSVALTSTSARYITFAGEVFFDSTEANQKCLTRTAMTLQNMWIYVLTNTSTAGPTLVSRINGVSGNLTKGLGTTTGALEDTTHTDTVASGDLLNMMTSGGTSPNIAFGAFISGLSTTNKQNSYANAVGSAATNFNSATTYYWPFGGRMQNTTTEGGSTNYDPRASAGISVTFSNVYCYVSADTLNGTKTITVRKNAGNANGTVQFGSSSGAGSQEDSTHTDSVVASDLLNWADVNVGSSGTFTPQTLSVLMNTAVNYTQSLAGAMTPAGAPALQTSKPLAGAFTPAGTETRSASKAYAGSLAPAGNPARSCAKPFTGGMTPAGAPVKSTSKALAGAGTPSGSVVRALSRSLAGALTSVAGAMVRQTDKAVAGTLTEAGSITRDISQLLAGALTPQGAMQRALSRTLSGVIASIGSVASRVIVLFYPHVNLTLNISRTVSYTLETHS
jgi:hypothetical protein